jgi:hypothetical protein
VRLGPYGAFLYGAGQTLTLARDPGGVAQTAWTTSGSVRFQPIPQYDTTLEARVSANRLEQPSTSVRTTTVGASLANRFDVYDTLGLSATGGINRQEFASGGSTDYLTASGYANAELRRDVTLRLEASAQRTVARHGEISAAEASIPLVRIVTYEMYTAEARYRPTPLLALTLRVGWAAADAGEGVIQSYRASWSPFPGGAVQLSFDYSQEVDPLTGQSFRRVAATPRWNINRHAALQLSYVNARGTGPTPVRQENVFVTFGVTL